MNCQDQFVTENDRIGRQRATGYNVQLGIRVEDAKANLDQLLEVLSQQRETEPSLTHLALRVVDGPGGYKWAVLEGLVEAESPATAAVLVERLIDPPIRASSKRFSSAE